MLSFFLTSMYPKEAISQLTTELLKKSEAAENATVA